MSPQQQAGILCSDAAFRRFLIERHGRWFDAQAAAIAVRAICGVGSRRELATDHRARVIWHQIVSEYRQWEVEPQVIG